MDEEYWIVVVDDDISNLKIAGSILSANDMRVTALSSGSALLDLIGKGNEPDLILLDILMPGMDGFETLKALRRQERGNSSDNTGFQNKYSGIPVVLLTAEDNRDTAEKGYELGALDIIRKPFDPTLLVERIENIVAGSRHMKRFPDRTSGDSLTGLLNKTGTEKLLAYKLGKESGTLILLDIDNFRMINKSFGHDAGDRLLAALAVILKNAVRADDMVGRTGSDEFAVFLKDYPFPDKAADLLHILNEKLLAEAKRMFGSGIEELSFGVSAGSVIAEKGSIPEDLFVTAERMLISAKREGRHGCAVYSDGKNPGEERRHSDELTKLCMIFDEQNTTHKALCTEGESFGIIYRYIMRHIKRYNGTVQKVLITADAGGISGAELSAAMDKLCVLTSGMLRNSDIIYRSSPDQLFLLLPMVSDADLPGIIKRIFSAWEKEDHEKSIKLSYVYEHTGNSLPEYPAVEGLDWRYAKLNLPTDKLLADTVEDLYTSIPKRLERLEDFFARIDESEGIRSYRTEIHAMKSASALIGLMQLSGLAKLLEGYAANNDAEGVKMLHGVFVKECGKSYEQIGKAFGFDGGNAEKPDGKAVLPALLGVLKSSLDEMDMETADRVLNKIRSYSYDSHTTGLLDKLTQAAVELDDSAYDIIKELSQ